MKDRCIYKIGMVVGISRGWSWSMYALNQGWDKEGI